MTEVSMERVYIVLVAAGVVLGALVAVWSYRRREH